jgi:hypothetical protein
MRGLVPRKGDPMGRCAFTFAGVLALIGSPLSARDLVVSPDVGPYKTIGEAIAASKEGDSILVKPGRYLEAKVLAIPHSLRILGDDPRTVQVIPPKGATATFSVENARAVHLDGLGIQGPATSEAAAIATRGGSVTVTHCVVRAGDVGIDIGLGGSWLLNLDAKYIMISTDADLMVGGDVLDTIDVDVDPWVYGVGIGYRF